MAKSIFDEEVITALQNARAAATEQATKVVLLQNGDRLDRVNIPTPYPSPTDWRDCWIYFLMLDRYNNPDVDGAPRGTWNQRFDSRQGGTFAGVTAQLDYIKQLGAGAIWISPVLKNSRPDQWKYNYHGYGAQDFLNLDERFASDGTLATAEKELKELVDQAHVRGMYIILDMVINHSARVFDYTFNGNTYDIVQDNHIMNAPPGQEPDIEWLNGIGFPRKDWSNVIPADSAPSADDAIYPQELREKLFFRRRGNKLDDDAKHHPFVKGDFGAMRQFVVEYDASADDQAHFRERFGSKPVLTILILIHQYLMAKYDFDGFRIDTVKYVDPDCVEIFGNAVREFAQSIGKRNFFTFGEIYDDENTIAHFVGRNASDVDSYGIDAALDFPLFYLLPAVAKMIAAVESIRGMFDYRKTKQSELLSTHGDAGRYFVSFLENHDQSSRFNHPSSFHEQILMGYALLFFLQGIPSLYYGCDQDLQGTVDGNGNPDLTSPESVREALWGNPTAFHISNNTAQQIKALSALRAREAALRFGRLYFREVSGNGKDFGHSTGVGGLVAFSRVLADREVTVVANTHTTASFEGYVLQDVDLNRTPKTMDVAYSNRAGAGSGAVQLVSNANFYSGGQLTGVGDTARIAVILKPMEVQVLVPA